MLTYYLKNAFRSMMRNPALTALMIAAIATGIGVSMTMVTIYYLMDGNPIPNKSSQLHRVLVDSWSPLQPYDSDDPSRAPDQMTWIDATNLLQAGAGRRQVAMFRSKLVAQPDDKLPIEVSTRVTSGDFFPMFDVPFLYGSGWSPEIDANPTPVVVLSKGLNDKLFGGENSVGKRLRANQTYFTITGVMDTWEPFPRFYDVTNSAFNPVEEAFVPLALTPGLKLDSSGNTNGWKSEKIVSYDDRLNSEMIWLQYWTELHTPAEQQAYLAHLDNYAEEQKKLGRFERPVNNHTYNVMDWMRYNEVVVDEVRVLIGLGFLFFLVCLLSCVSILLTKVNGRRAELSLRRALGATRPQILLQNLAEVAVIGGIGGIFGLGLAQVGLSAIRSGISQAPPGMFQIDWFIVGLSMLIAVSASIIAGLYPAWQACLVAPATELKTQ